MNRLARRVATCEHEECLFDRFASFRLLKPAMQLVNLALDGSPRLDFLSVILDSATYIVSSTS